MPDSSKPSAAMLLGYATPDRGDGVWRQELATAARGVLLISGIFFCSLGVIGFYNCRVPGHTILPATDEDFGFTLCSLITGIVFVFARLILRKALPVAQFACNGRAGTGS